MSKKTRILITGGSGFIGSHIAKKFLDNNYSVEIFDIQDPELEGADFSEGDIFNFEGIKNVIEHNDVIVHMIGLADAGIAQKSPRKSYKLNITSLQNVLEACRSLKEKKIIFPSSAAVYGVTDDLPIKENFPLNPTNIYSWHKMICENMIKAYQKNYGVEYVILRLFNVYGQGHKGVIDLFIKRAKKQEIIESFGPYQYRDFVYAGDVADAIYRAVAYDKAVNRVINIGSGKGMQIKTILEMICEVFPQAKWEEIKSEFVMYDSIADITIAKILLDFNPQSSEEFIKKVIKEEML